MATLLSLPVEIRLQIYDHLLRAPDYMSFMSIKHVRLCPAILSTCRQVYTEAMPTLYSKNRFVAHYRELNSCARLRGILTPVTSAFGRSLIRRWYIRLNLDCPPAFRKGDVSAAFTGAEELVLDLNYVLFMSKVQEYEVLDLFSGVRAVKRVDC